uniref:Uncharacterized protein n=1 Tax=Arundo donax TaxID=35708 RepID=A0A0A9CC18_ARUDO
MQPEKSEAKPLLPPQDLCAPLTHTPT